MLWAVEDMKTQSEAKDNQCLLSAYYVPGTTDYLFQSSELPYEVNIPIPTLQMI